MEVLKDLPDKSVDMIYSDPDYNVGINYAGERYTKKWDEYVSWYCEIVSESMRVLKRNGNLFTINYPRQNAHLRVKCLEHLAQDLHEYAWIYNTNVGHSKRRFTTAHRTILHATKSTENVFYKEQVAQPYKNPEDRRIRQRIANGERGRMPYSWFYFDLVKNVSKEKTFHSCQIPLGLTEMLINATTKPGDTVFILFGGSGSEVLLAKNMNRVFLSCEINRKYHRMILDRLNNNGQIQTKYKCMHNQLKKPLQNNSTSSLDLDFKDIAPKTLARIPKARS